MPEIPECLHRRYRALDDLVNELSTLPGQGIQGEFGNSLSHQPGIKLMCDFWNILKEDPNCDLSKAVKQRMAVEMPSSGSTFSRQRVTCYMAGRANGRDSDITSGCKKKDPINKIKDICCNSPTSNKSGSFDFTSRDKLPDIPLTKALCSLKEAASLDKKCNVRITELMETQKELKSQIQNLEQNERDGVTLLKEADCLWSCMEEEYKTKITESINRHKELMKQLKEVEKSNAKWRRNKKELDDQLKLVCKCRQELTEKSTRKKNDLQIVEMEITDFSKRVATNKRLLEGAKQNQANKKSASDKRIARITTETNKLKNTLDDMQKYKGNKENDGQNFIKEAREDLQKICKILLQKKIENEDLAAEKEALLQEIDLLKQTCDQCKDKCQTKRESLQEAIKRMEKDIGDYRNQCIRCHQCTDTSDARTLCSDCPRCKEQRECKTAGDYCERDATYDCVCISVKEKFLNNVFENMYTVLERQSKTKPGKALADSIVKCLKNSRNGKLNAETKTQVQTFVLNTVKKNLNLTIIGGAVKTRCEMDQDTYKQLMLCLKQVKEEKPPKEDKGTVAKKESCKRWGGATECNCPGGPKYCACIMRAPPPPKEPSTCPPEKPNPPPGTVVLCPHKEAVGCGPVCAMGGASPSPAEGVKKFTDCATDCPFQKNMRAAQCVLGPDSMYSLPKTYMSSSPHVPEDSGLTETVKCKWCGVAANSCVCRRDRTTPRNRIIEEVLGKYSEVAPVKKVTKTVGGIGEQRGQINGRNCSNTECVCNVIEYASNHRTSQTSDCSSEVLLLEGTDALIDMLRKKKVTHVCKTIWDGTSNARGAVKLYPKPESSCNKSCDAKVHVILNPKFCPDIERRTKTSNSTASCSTGYSSKQYGNTKRHAERKYVSRIGVDCEKKVDVKQALLKDIMVSDKIDDNSESNIQWRRVDSIINFISSQPDSRKHKQNVSGRSQKSSQKTKKSVTYSKNDRIIMNTKNFIPINSKQCKIRPAKTKIINNNANSHYVRH